MKSIKTKAIMLITSVAFVVGCTQEKEYDTVYKADSGKDQVLNKEVVDTSADYLYVVSTVETPRKSTATRPFWMGDAKKVRLKFTEDALKIIEPEKDGRFADNPMNASTVINIPVTHVDYRCAEDSYGKCTHREEENTEISWDKKTKFKLDASGMAQVQVPLLPIAIDNLFGACHQEINSEVVYSKIESDAINIQVDKTFQAVGPCVNGIFSLDQATYTVRYHYSVVKMEKLASQGYQKVEYGLDSQNRFGFFLSSSSQLDVDNNDVQGSETYLLDRWNPAKTVDYYMNDTFNKPELKSLKEATYEAVKAVNLALKKAGTSLQINLKEPVPGMMSGDLRNNMIVAEDDPQASGVIGYGPHASNPDTGEIVHARTVMYVGTLMKYVKYTYDDIVKKKMSQVSSLADGKTLSLSEALSVAAENSSDRVSVELSSEAQQTDILASLNIGAGLDIDDLISKDIKVAQIKEKAAELNKEVKQAENLQEILEELSKNNNYPAEMINFHGELEDAVAELMTGIGVKPWIALSAGEKQKVLDALLPLAYLPTLIHELGHNLGLRHNFAGSEDKANFYTQEEMEGLKAGLVESTCTPEGSKKLSKYEFSSIMDYSYRSASELPAMGKYDVAALRYAYARQVELEPSAACEKGKMVSVEQLIAEPELKIKPYQFCTDEHVSANPNCNRFDAGTNVLEITQNTIQAYEERYELANLRNGRRDFSLYGEAGYIGGVLRTFMGLRNVFERYESIKNRFGLPDDSPYWVQIPFLKELKDATLMAGRFYMDVLKVPDTMCAVSAAANPSQILAVLPIRDLSSDAISCFDTVNIQLNPAYVIIAQGGKSFQSRKSPFNPNSYVDQIDVRGVWVDKLLASRFLLSRSLGSVLFDKYTQNFLDIPELQAEIVNTYAQIMEDQFVAPVEFTIINGQKAKLTIGYSTFSPEEAKNGHNIVVPLSRVAKRYMEVPDHSSSFQEVLLSGLVDDIGGNGAFGQNSEVFKSLFQVLKDLPNRNNSTKGYVTTEIGGAKYFASNSSVLAAQTVSNYNVVSLLDGLGQERVKELVELLEKSKGLIRAKDQCVAVSNLAEGVDVESLVKRVKLELDRDSTCLATDVQNLGKSDIEAILLGEETLKRYLQGGFQSLSFYKMMIQTMAKM